jgi:PAS domain S-box-containing protein
MADETGAIFWYNQRWYDYTGTTLEEMQGSGLRKIHHPEYESQVVSRYFACVKAGEMWEDTFPLRGKNGEWRWFLSRARPIRDEEGRIVRWFGTNTDVTEQLETERDLRRANQDLEQFAFTASHDLQEPLRNVAIYSQLLKKRAGSSLGEESEQFLSYIVEGAQRMGNLISDLLAYTQAGILDVQRIEPVEAESVLDQVVSNLSQVIAEARAEIRHKPLPALAVKEAHLQQLLQNLIGNAIKYRRDDAAPCIEVSAVRADGFWQLSVQDNGIGIPPQFHEKVFGIFKRLHPNSGKYSGTGIGLAICQRIVERYGGRIWLESGVGLGTTFHFTLPSTDRDETTSMSLAVVE